MTIRQGTNVIAGANLDVSNKANISLDNINDNGKDIITEMGLPSGRVKDFSVGKPLTEYVAPANGYFNVTGTATSATAYITSEVTATNPLYRVFSCSISGFAMQLMLEARRGVVYKFGYGGCNLAGVRFIYAEGSK